MEEEYTYDDDAWEIEEDGQPSEYDEWQDYMAVTIGIMGSLTQERCGNMQTVKVGWENNQKNKYIRVIEFENGYSA